MRKITLLSFAALATGLSAQSNVVPGLDGRLTNVNNLTYWGRRGPTHPNGEVGMSMLNTMCNPGSVNIPWAAAMQENHPWFGFIITRVANDRIEQINEWSFCKHAWTSVNVNGACGTCVNPGTGALMGLNCSDTYGAGTNANRDDLGPPSEIDPWLGTWNAVGSYFDLGDPSQPGYPLPADGNDSLDNSIFLGDEVWNRVIVDETDLLTPGGQYYYGIQLIHNGEAVANRWDNLAHRGFNPSWSGTQWSFSNDEGQEYGTILSRWPGATINEGGNGNDDGRFFVASKVTSLGGGNFHYEYAVHNVDNSRAGSVFRVPVPAGVTVTNATFGDIDTDGSNDWTFAQVGTELVWTASAGNPLEWNTIYNFGFDADIASGTGTVRLDEARPGPGNSFVDVTADVPGGVILASFDTYGAGCEGTTQEPATPCPDINPAGGSLSNSTNGFEYCFRVDNTNPIQVDSFDIFTGTTGGSITRPAYIYSDAGGSPSTTPLATSTITVNQAAGFYTATFNPPVSVSGTFYIGYENTPSGYISNLTSGTPGVGYFRTPGPGNWTQSGLVDFPSWRVNCTPVPQFLVPSLGNNGLPVIGGTYDLTVSDALPVTFAAIAHGFTDQAYQGIPLPLVIPGTNNCQLLMSADVLNLAITSPTGDAASPLTLPGSASLAGTELYHQWIIFDAANSLGLVFSNGGRSLVGF